LDGVPWGLILSTVIVAMLLYTGWKGGELVYRYRVGMQPDDDRDLSSADGGRPIMQGRKAL
jgi:uncharacterized membrane protein